MTPAPWIAVVMLAYAGGTHGSQSQFTASQRLCWEAAERIAASRPAGARIVEMSCVDPDGKKHPVGWGI